MPVKHCPTCLSKDGLFVIVWPDDSVCRVCKSHPGDVTEQLTPHEIRICLKKEEE